MGQCDALISICKSISATAQEPALACRRDEYTDAALAVPVDEIPDTIEWTERYLETLKVRTLAEWASKKRAECVLKHATPGSKVQYAGAEYEVARVERGMVGIYDETPSRHVDFINPRNLTLAAESQREAAGTADEKPDGHAENAKDLAQPGRKAHLIQPTIYEN